MAMNNLKRQYLPAGLWIVATPIGNLQDLSPRALEALRAASGVLCEDTRRTSALLNALGIPRDGLERFDAHSSDHQISRIAERLSQGESLALVTDAGTPAVSDPGAALVSKARELGVVVTPLPGPSAPVTLLSVAGFRGTEFTFAGFFPRKDGERRKLLMECEKSRICRVFVWFESPQRISSALDAVASEHSQARIVAGKELTKIHERVFAGAASKVAAQIAEEVAREGEVGEWAFAVEFPESVENSDESSDWVKSLRCLLDARVSASEAARQVSQHFGVAKNSVYALALELSGKKIKGGD